MKNERDIMAGYIRFETPYRCEMHGHPLGVFRGMSPSRENEIISEWGHELIEDAVMWFNEHLPLPPSEHLDRRAIFWFHAGAHIVREMWQFVSVLRLEGVQVALRHTAIPGRIVYRDDFQIAAIAYGHGRRPRRRRRH